MLLHTAKIITTGLLLALGGEVQAAKPPVRGGFVSAPSPSCPNVLTPSYPLPQTRDGYAAQLVAKGFAFPRGIVFDTKGALLLVEARNAIRHITFNDNGGTCLSVKDNTILVSSNTAEDPYDLASFPTFPPPRLQILTTRDS